MILYWASPHTDPTAWQGWIPLGHTVEGAGEAFTVAVEPELSDDEYELLRMPLAGRSLSVSFRITTLQAWHWHRMFTGCRHPGERAARQRYVRRLRARRKRVRR